MFPWMRCGSSSDLLEWLFSMLREQHSINEDVEYRGLHSISTEVHLDGTKAQSTGKSRGGWNAIIHMISASGWMTMIYLLVRWKFPRRVLQVSWDSRMYLPSNGQIGAIWLVDVVPRTMTSRTPN